jgi:hypothetical protein
MKVVVYHRTVPNAKNLEKVDVLKHFATGVQRAHDELINATDHQYHDAKVGVIQGWVGPIQHTSAHQLLRNTVIQRQLSSNQYVVAIDSNLFLYSTPGNPDHYLRYSFNGVFPDTGIYCDSTPDPVRWQKISSKLKIALKPYRQQGDHILLCLQRNSGWSMGNYNVAEWAINTINVLRAHTDRPIVVRAHPGDKTSKDYLSNFSALQSKRVTISPTGTSLLDNLQNCWAVVNHNSSPAVAAAIEGYPIFVTDPDRSQCQEIANTDLSQIESPQMPERQAWIERLSMFHWDFDELQSGKCWAHMRQFVR